MKFFLKPFRPLQFINKRQLVGWSLVFVILTTFILTPSRPVSAQMITSDIMAAAQRINIDVGNKFWNKVLTALARAGSVSFQQLLKTALNKIAYDTATYIGAGDRGQKPLFVTEDWGSYLLDIGNKSAGQFIENFVNTFSNTLATVEMQKSYQECSGECDYEACFNKVEKDQNLSEEEQRKAFQKCRSDYLNCQQSCRALVTNKGESFVSTTSNQLDASKTNRRIINVCQPSSVNAQLKISLGLASQNEPQMPNCSATELIQNWGDEIQRLTTFDDPYFLDKVKNVFNPISNDLGIYMSLKTDLTNQVEYEKNTSQLKLSANKGWLDVRNIAGDMGGTPGSAESKKYITESNYSQALLKTTGDIVVDAANIFLNQLALQSFNNLMSKLGEKSKTAGQNLVNYSADPTVAYGEASVKEAIAKVFAPKFGTNADYNVLIGLSSCPDKNNPGPTECVIDNLLMQAIT